MATGLLRTGVSAGANGLTGAAVGYGTALGGPAGRVWAEDVYDVFTDLTPWEHPIISMLPHEDTDAVQVNWIIKKLNPIKSTLDAKEEGYYFPINPDGAGGVVSTLADARFEPRAVSSNYIENFTLPLSVSSRARAVDMLGGGGDEFNLRAAEAVKEMGRNIEIRFFDDTFACDVNTNFIGTIAANPSRAKPLMELLFENRLYLHGAGTASASKLNLFRSTDFARVDRDASSEANLVLNTNEMDRTAWPVWAQQRFTETMLTKAQELMRGSKFSNTSVRPDTVVVPPANFGQAGGFGVGTGTGDLYGDLSINMDSRMEAISRVVRYFRSNFGLVQIIESPWLDQAKNTGAATTMTINTNSTPRSEAAADRNVGLVWLFDRKFLSVCWFQRPALEKLAKINLGDNGLVWSELTFKLLHPMAAGVIIGVNNVSWGQGGRRTPLPERRLRWGRLSR